MFLSSFRTQITEIILQLSDKIHPWETTDAAVYVGSQREAIRISQFVQGLFEFLPEIRINHGKGKSNRGDQNGGVL
jgi:hypothetical protein